MSKKVRDEWLRVVVQILDNVTDVSEIECPRCGQRRVDFQYIGDPDTRIGALFVWCGDCLYGVRVSRTKVPNNVYMIPFDADEQVVEKRIPAFVDVLQ